jgi:hypothetical protein
MNRRGILKLLPLAALGLAVKPQPTEATTVIESAHGVKLLTHRESFTSREFRDAIIVNNDYRFSAEEVRDALARHRQTMRRLR